MKEFEFLKSLNVSGNFRSFWLRFNSIPRSQISIGLDRVENDGMSYYSILYTKPQNINF